MSIIITNAVANPAGVASSLLAWPGTINDLYFDELQELLECLFDAGFTAIATELAKADGLTNSTRAALSEIGAAL